MRIHFLGFGSMAHAIAQGLVKHGYKQISASAPSLPTSITKSGIQTSPNNKALIHDADMLICAVKPNQMATALAEIKNNIPAHCLIISVAAGLSLDWLSKNTANQQAIIRTMPNLPAAVGLAATPLIANNQATSKQKQSAEAIFKSIGITTWLEDERQMDSFTALSGSGPGYVFLFMQSLLDAAITLGIDKETAKSFTMQTLKGAIKYADLNDLDFNALKTKVTSPNGTTYAALKVLEPELNQLIDRALRAAMNRAHELGNSN